MNKFIENIPKGIATLRKQLAEVHQKKRWARGDEKQETQLNKEAIDIMKDIKYLEDYQKEHGRSALLIIFIIAFVMVCWMLINWSVR